MTTAALDPAKLKKGMKGVAAPKGAKMPKSKVSVPKKKKVK